MADLTKYARALRQHQTDAERRLWSHLRGRNLAGYKFRRQVPMDHYIVDFLCHDVRLIVELDGGQHGEDAAMAYDEHRTHYLERAGYRVMRFPNHEVMKDIDHVLEVILHHIQHP
jgi:very-short-patch-repair endonuclease